VRQAAGEGEFARLRRRARSGANGAMDRGSVEQMLGVLVKASSKPPWNHAIPGARAIATETALGPGMVCWVRNRTVEPDRSNSYRCRRLGAQPCQVGMPCHHCRCKCYG